MRLLHVDTRTFQDFNGSPPPYAIASHRWTDEEVSYQDFKNVNNNTNLNTAGWRKVRGFCRAVKNLQTLGPKIEWVWIDTCCINKADFTEFSEAINSMFRWYAEAEICITYLPDVKSLDGNPIDIIRQFRSSVWFLRGWTLQELLAPALVVFLNQDWEPLGHKQGGRGERPKKFSSRSVGFSMNSRLVEITGIPNSVLYDFEKSKTLSVAEKQAWMKNRTTTRPEDRAYCQLGILGIFMPLIYGEREQAMIRLQDELERKELREKAAQPRSGPSTPIPTPPNNNLKLPLGDTPLARRHSTGAREPRRKPSPDERKQTPSPKPSTKTLKIKDWLNNGKEFSITVSMDMTIGGLKDFLASPQYLGKPPMMFRFAYFDSHHTKIAKNRFDAGYADTKLRELKDLSSISVVSSQS